MVPTTDVIVVGGGIAGMSAALEASAGGARVLLVEAAERLGGAARISGGGVCAPGTSVQRRLAVADDPGLALCDWLSWGGSEVDEEWAQFYLQNAATEVVDWFTRLGVEWIGLVWQEGNSALRWHRPRGAGRSLTDALEGALAAAPCELLLGTRVTDLRPGTPVTVSLSDGRTVSAAAVIVTTGGYVDDRVRLESWSDTLRRVPRWLSGGIAGARGSGTDILVRLGAVLVGRDALWVYPVGTPDPQDADGRRGLVVRGVDHEIWVNAHGVRFQDETLRGGASGTRALLSQPGCTCWGIFDAETARGLRLLNNDFYAVGEGVLDAAYDTAGRAAEWLLTSRYVHTAGDIADLARAAGLPADQVTRSVAVHNDRIRAGLAADSEFGRPLQGLRPIEKPPFHAVQYFPVVQKCLGGVRTDLECRVLYGDGAVIPAVYAAGEVAGMAGGQINGRAALEGTMLGPSVFSGRLAGRNAARLVEVPRAT